jgi:hypothetical protein
LCQRVVTGTLATPTLMPPELGRQLRSPSQITDCSDLVIVPTWGHASWLATVFARRQVGTIRLLG